MEYVFMVKWDHKADSGMLGIFRALEGAKAAAEADYAEINDTDSLVWSLDGDAEDPWWSTQPITEHWYFIERIQVQD